MLQLKLEDFVSMAKSAGKEASMSFSELPSQSPARLMLVHVEDKLAVSVRRTVIKTFTKTSDRIILPDSSQRTCNR